MDRRMDTVLSVSRITNSDGSDHLPSDIIQDLQPSRPNTNNQNSALPEASEFNIDMTKNNNIQEIFRRREWDHLNNFDIKQMNYTPNPISFISSSNKSKNRYSNISPNEGTRVKLCNNFGKSDYINANYIQGFDEDCTYIATQAPLPYTIDDFWWMIWERGCSVIVMLTRLIEGNVTKAHRYWPKPSHHMQCGDIKIKLISERITEYHLKIRDILLEFQNEKRKVRHYQYLNWPDHSVPDIDETLRLLQFTDVSLSLFRNKGIQSPLVVHCSAGVGRTGAFIVIHTTLTKLVKEKKEITDVSLPDLVKKIRSQRSGMVSNEEQYLFCYKVIETGLMFHKARMKSLNDWKLRNLGDSGGISSSTTTTTTTNTVIDNNGSNKEDSADQKSNFNPLKDSSNCIGIDNISNTGSYSKNNDIDDDGDNSKINGSNGLLNSSFILNNSLQKQNELSRSCDSIKNEIIKDVDYQNSKSGPFNIISENETSNCSPRSLSEDYNNSWTNFFANVGDNNNNNNNNNMNNVTDSIKSVLNNNNNNSNSNSGNFEKYFENNYKTDENEKSSSDHYQTLDFFCSSNMVHKSCLSRSYMEITRSGKLEF